MSLLLLNIEAGAAPLPADWQREQSFTVPAAGLTKLSLPAETLNAARPGLEDLRLYDDAGHETPYLIERPRPAETVVQNARSFQVTLLPSETVITIQTGMTQPLAGVTLETPAPAFIKSIKVEGSKDGNQWQPLAEGRPVFRQPNGVSQLRVPLTPAAWPWLRFTVDDQRSPPIPFTGARVEAAAAESAPNEPLSVTITDRHENPGETRLSLDLGAANLTLSEIHIETPEPLFTRTVALAVPQVAEDSIREQTLTQGVIYRIAVEGRPPASNLTLHAESQVPSRDALLLIRNQDSPPLPITAVRAERRPVYLVFLAQEAVAYHLLTGNSRCAAPRYDLAALGADLRTVPVTALHVSAPADNPDYRAPEVLPGIEDSSATLDVASWRFRKPIRVVRAGAAQVELDLDVLAVAQPGFQDVRLMRGNRQVPYILEHTSIRRLLTPVVTTAAYARDPGLSRWLLRLPRPRLPVTRLVCTAQTPLFQRDVVLYENTTDARGDAYRRVLGQGTWVQTPAHTDRECALTLADSPQSDLLILETRNGDNPPIELADFRFYYPATRMLFKARPVDELALYYGNADVAPPRYDLNLVAGELVKADKSTATLGAEEPLKRAPWAASRLGRSGIVFWGVLGLVVAGLLAVMARLLPKPAPGDAGPKPDGG
jgi:hypothetical protein